jgi:hypothetical protein
VAAKNTTHGRTYTPEYNAWNAMKNRCYYTRHKDYANYGGRGIRVCQRWLDSFEDFFADVGPRPSIKHTIDRLDSNGHYWPGNVRWANRYEQSGNRRNTIRVTLPDGRDVSLKAAARHYGANYGSVREAVHVQGEDPHVACQRLGAGLKKKSGPRPKAKACRHASG